MFGQLLFSFTTFSTPTEELSAPYTWVKVCKTPRSWAKDPKEQALTRGC